MNNTQKALEVLLNTSNGTTTLDSQSSLEIQKYIAHLEVVLAESKDKLSRRNMQIKDLKENKDLFHNLYVLAEGSISQENFPQYLKAKEKILYNNR